MARSNARSSRLCGALAAALSWGTGIALAGPFPFFDSRAVPHEVSFGLRAEIIAYAVSPFAAGPADVWLAGLGQTRRLVTGGNRPRVSPDEAWVALARETPDGPSLQVWSARTQELIVQGDGPIQSFGPLGEWSPDSRWFFFSTRQAVLSERTPDIVKVSRTDQSTEGEVAPPQSELGIFDARQGTITVVPAPEPQNTSIVLGVSAAHGTVLVAAHHDVRQAARPTHRQRTVRLYTLDARAIGAEPTWRRLAEVESLLATQRPTWSPDGRWIACVTEGALANNDVSLYPVDGGEPVVLTGRMPADSAAAAIPIEARHFRHRAKNLSFGPADHSPGWWLPDGSGVLFLKGQTELWLAQREGCRPVWRSDGSEISEIVGDACTGTASLLDGKLTVLVTDKAGDRRTRLVRVAMSGDIRIDEIGSYASGTSLETYAALTHRLGLLVPTGNPTARVLGEPSGVMLRDLGGKNERWILPSPDLGHRSAVRTQRLEWMGGDGKAEGGFLLLPEARSESNLPPCVVVVYPLTNRRNPHYESRSFLPAGITLALVENGYALCQIQPRLERNGRTCEQIVAAVQHAVNALKLTGTIDPARLALAGYSFGGYSVNCVATSPSEFRAFVSLAGMSNLMSVYQSPNSLVVGQAEMQEPMYAHLADYMENSPALFADRVSRPMLLIHGGKDESTPARDAEMMFTALRQLGKPAELAIYPVAGHDLSSMSIEARDNLVSRVLEFLKRYLAD